MDGKQHHQEDKRVPKSQRRETGQVGSAWQSDMLPAGMAPQQGLQGIPAGAGAQGMRQAAVLQMQRQGGNGVVQRMLTNHPTGVQRRSPAPPSGGAQLPDNWINDVNAPGPSTDSDANTPSTIRTGASVVTTDGDSVTIDAPNVTISAPTVNLDSEDVYARGLLRASTVIADTVVGTSYTPGVGNQM